MLSPKAFLKLRHLNNVVACNFAYLGTTSSSCCNFNIVRTLMSNSGSDETKSSDDRLLSLKRGTFSIRRRSVHDFHAPDWDFGKQHREKPYGYTPEKVEYYNQVVWPPNHKTEEGTPKEKVKNPLSVLERRKKV